MERTGGRHKLLSDNRKKNHSKLKKKNYWTKLALLRYKKTHTTRYDFKTH